MSIQSQPGTGGGLRVARPAQLLLVCRFQPGLVQHAKFAYPLHQPLAIFASDQIARRYNVIAGIVAGDDNRGSGFRVTDRGVLQRVLTNILRHLEIGGKHVGGLSTSHGCPNTK